MDRSKIQKSKRLIRIGGRVLEMDDSFNPVAARDDISTKERRYLERDVSSGFGSRSSRDRIDLSPSPLPSSSPSSSSSSSPSSLTPSSETFSVLCERLDSLVTSSTGHRARAGSRSSSVTSLNGSLSRSGLETVGAASQNYFDPTDFFSQGPIFYMRPEFSKRIPTPKKFPDLSYDDFLVQQKPQVGSARASGDNSNWVLLPAASWGSASNLQAVMDSVEAKVKSGEAKNSGLGFWVMLKSGTLRRQPSEEK